MSLVTCFYVNKNSLLFFVKFWTFSPFESEVVKIDKITTNSYRSIFFKKNVEFSNLNSFSERETNKKNYHEYLDKTAKTFFISRCLRQLVKNHEFLMKKSFFEKFNWENIKFVYWLFCKRRHLSSSQGTSKNQKNVYTAYREFSEI